MSGRYIARYRSDINHTMSDVIQCQIDIGQLYMYQIRDKNTISISFHYNSIINNNFKPVDVVVAAAVVAVVQ